MEKPVITREQIATVCDNPHLRMYSMEILPGKHYYNASRRAPEDLMVLKDAAAAREALPDGVSCIVILCQPDREPLLLLSWEYRYPAGRCLLSVPAGLVDAADKAEADPLAVTAIRELKEETGLIFGPEDKVYTVSPFVYSTPGMTDESNGLVCMVLHPDDLSGLSQAGAEGTEFFDGFSLLTKDQAAELLRTGRDMHGDSYSIFTWAALMYFVSGAWQAT